MLLLKVKLEKQANNHHQQQQIPNPITTKKPQILLKYLGLKKNIYIFFLLSYNFAVQLASSPNLFIDKTLYIFF